MHFRMLGHHLFFRFVVVFVVFVAAAASSTAAAAAVVVAASCCWVIHADIFAHMHNRLSDTKVVLSAYVWPPVDFSR